MKLCIAGALAMLWICTEHVRFGFVATPSLSIYHKFIPVVFFGVAPETVLLSPQQLNKRSKQLHKRFVGIVHIQSESQIPCAVYHILCSELYFRPCVVSIQEYIWSPVTDFVMKF